MRIAVTAALAGLLLTAGAGRAAAEPTVVDLRGGTPPGSVGRMCIALAVLGTVEVPLSAPLGGRKVLAVER